MARTVVAGKRKPLPKTSLAVEVEPSSPGTDLHHIRVYHPKTGETMYRIEVDGLRGDIEIMLVDTIGKQLTVHPRSGNVVIVSAS